MTLTLDAEIAVPPTLGTLGGGFGHAPCKGDPDGVADAEPLLERVRASRATPPHPATPPTRRSVTHIAFDALDQLDMGSARAGRACIRAGTGNPPTPECHFHLDVLPEDGFPFFAKCHIELSAPERPAVTGDMPNFEPRESPFAWI
jgi:hypothetical protein